MAGDFKNYQGFITAYKQYKEDTSVIIGWLLSNALKHGFKSANSELRLVRMQELVPMAKCIVAGHSSAAFVIHPILHSKFRRAIAARKRHTAWYTTFTKGQDKSNESHAYFTDTLLKTWNVLLDASSASSLGCANGGNGGSSSVGSPTNPVSSNRFKPLSLDDISIDDPDDESPVESEAEIATKHHKKTKIKNKKRYYKKPKPKNTFKVDYATLVVNEEQREDDFWFAINCFLQEQFRLRGIVKGYWAAYAEGRLELEVAAIGTNLAIDLIRRSEAELAITVTYPARFSEKDWPVWKLPLLLLAQHFREGRLTEILKDNGSWDAHDNTLVQSLEFFTVYDYFFSFVAAKNDLDAPLLEICEQIASQPKLEGEQHVLYFLINAQIMSRNLQERAPLIDEICRGLQHVDCTNEVFLWAVFAHRILLDMHRLLPHKAGLIFSPIQPAAEVEGQFQMMLKTTHLTDIRDLTRCKHSRGYGFYQDSLRRSLLWFEDEGADKAGSMRLHAINPLQCGLQKYMLFRTRQAAVRGENCCFSGPLWPAAYLYVAGRILFPESVTWPDMEYMLQRYGESIFATSQRAPQTLSDLTNMYLVMGDRALRAQRHHHGRYEDGHLAQDGSILGKYQARRLYTCPTHAADERDNFKDMIRDMYGKPALSQLAMKLGMDPEQQEEGRSFVKGWASRLHTWTPEAVLELTQLYASVDLADVCFDWETLNETCNDLCHRIIDALHDDCCSYHSTIGDRFFLPEYLPRLLTKLETISKEFDPLSSTKHNKEERGALLMQKLEQKVPWFAAFWDEIQGFCTERIKLPGCNRDGDEIDAFVGEQGIATLFYLDTHRSVACNPSKLLVKQYKAWFKGWSDDSFKRTTSKKLGDRVEALLDNSGGKKTKTRPELSGGWKPTYEEKMQCMMWYRNLCGEFFTLSSIGEGTDI